MKKGQNVRMFNTNTLKGGRHIGFEEATGYVTLQPGTYQVDGYSITTFGYVLTPDQQSKVRSMPGYAYLWNVDAKKITTLGSMQEPMFSQASHVNDILSITKKTRFYLGHQNGEDVGDLFVACYFAPATTSIDHVYARLIIRRLSD
jgi:hypothetical protein